MNIEYKEENNYPKAFLATGIIIGIIVALCFFLVYSQPAKVDEGMGGILVNYGTTDEGSGKDVLSMEEPSKAEKANKEQPTKVTPEQTTETKPSTETSDKKVVTQDAEDAPAVADKSKKATAPVAAATPKAAKPQVVNQAALFKGTPNKGTGQGDGTTEKAGNQGSAQGSTLTNAYGQGGSGNGLSLAGWQFVNQPEVKNVHRVPGVVVVDFTIDQNGNVLTANYNREKSRADLDLINSCVDAIQRSKFTSKASATGNQRGQMTFRFNVD
jgi:TonB family protein